MFKALLGIITTFVVVFGVGARKSSQMRKATVAALIIFTCAIMGVSSAHAYYTDQVVSGTPTGIFGTYPINFLFSSPNDGDGGYITGTLTISIIGSGPTVLFTPNITYSHYGLSITEPRYVDLVDGFAYDHWDAPGSTAENSLKLDASTRRHLLTPNEGSAFVYGGHSNPVPELPAGAVIPMGLALLIGMVWLRRRQVVVS